MEHGVARRTLLSQITELEGKLAALRAQLQELELQEGFEPANELGGRDVLQPAEMGKHCLRQAPCVRHNSLPLSLKEYARYGRQMIVPGVGLEGILTFFPSLDGGGGGGGRAPRPPRGGAVIWRW